MNIEHPGISPGGKPSTFEEYLLRVNPTQASLQNLAEQPDNTAIVMLNLLRFRPRGNNTIYSLYGKEVAPIIKELGSFVGYYGKVVTNLNPALGFDDSWDGVVMPVYHRRNSYLDLQKNTVYQLAIPFRTAGTSRRVLYPLADGEKIYQDTVEVGQLDAMRQPLEVKRRRNIYFRVA